MKTPEDEAFDELARKQGAWGGGFQAKRQMAMDKINSEFHEEYKKMHEDRVKYGTAWSQDGKRIDPMSVYKEQPAQEPVALVIDGVLVKSALPEKYTGHLYTTPPQREWVGLEEKDMPGGEDPMYDHPFFIAGLVWAANKLKERNYEH